MSALLTVAALPLFAHAASPSVLSNLPASPDPAARYVIYLHGRIIEDQGPRPTHPVWGVYEYHDVLQALAAPGVAVVSERRPPATDMDRYALHVADQVRALLRAGVSAPHIAVVGFSKGGGIAMRVSSLLRNRDLNFVLLAACGDGNFRGSPLRLWGRVLSIVEASDEAGRSCRSLFDLSAATGERDERVISVGGGHGAFFRPNEAWVLPARRWVLQPR